jgi:hypothetical protein
MSHPLAKSFQTFFIYFRNKKELSKSIRPFEQNSWIQNALKAIKLYLFIYKLAIGSCKFFYRKFWPMYRYVYIDIIDMTFFSSGRFQTFFPSPNFNIFVKILFFVIFKFSDLPTS